MVLSWGGLDESTRWALAGKLRGLWGWSHDDEVFDALPTHRQQALLLLLRRLQQLGLWEAVRTITNIYGEGGVGIEFVAWPMLRSKVVRRRRFSRILAGHRNNQGGFRERRKQPGPALHVVMVAAERGQWAAHFDRYNPLRSPLEAWRHIYRESFRGELPSWYEIGGPITG